MSFPAIYAHPVQSALRSVSFGLLGHRKPAALPDRSVTDVLADINSEYELKPNTTLFILA